MARPYRELRDKMSPEVRERVGERTKQGLAVMDIAGRLMQARDELRAARDVLESMGKRDHVLKLAEVDGKLETLLAKTAPSLAGEDAAKARRQILATVEDSKDILKALE